MADGWKTPRRPFIPTGCGESQALCQRSSNYWHLTDFFAHAIVRGQSKPLDLRQVDHGHHRGAEQSPHGKPHQQLVAEQQSPWKQLGPWEFPQEDPMSAEDSLADCKWSSLGSSHQLQGDSCIGEEAGTSPHPKSVRSTRECKSGACILQYFATDIVLMTFSFLKICLVFYGNHYLSFRIRAIKPKKSNPMRT